MSTPDNQYCDAPTVPDSQYSLPAPKVTDTLPIGASINGYLLIHILAQSHCSTSYLAEDTFEKKQVVIKEYYPCSIVRRRKNGKILPITKDYRKKYAEGKQHFLQEACLLMTLKHKSIIQVRAVFLANDSVYMVMPYESGETLYHLMTKQSPMPQHELLKILTPINEALSCLHEVGCIHRDVKPSNIFLRKDEKPLLLDFSAALFKGESGDNCVPMISQGYTPIEQYSTSAGVQGEWTDIYALGAMLYKGVTGVVPVDAVERGQKILKVLEDPYEPLLTIAGNDYSLRFLSAIDHALCFRAEDRPQSIAEWQAELEGTAPVWQGADEVRKTLISDSARTVDFDLGLGTEPERSRPSSKHKT